MTTANAHTIEASIRDARDQDSFVQRVLIDALQWPVDEDIEDLDDLTYDWTAEDLRADGLDAKLVDGSVRQIRPFPNNPWGIFLLEFKNVAPFIAGRGMTGVLRRVLRGLVEKKRAVRDASLAAFRRENLLFICTHKFSHYRFGYFRAPADGVRTAPLASFGWGPGDPIRTLCEFNLSSLAWPEKEPETPEEWVTSWAPAFDVERVTKRFYDEYSAVFRQVERLAAESSSLAGSELRLFTQSLFNRLMFLRFIERKGWLAYPGQSVRDYLAALMNAGPQGNRSFYQSRLRPLFFQGMATEGRQSDPAYGAVPFLNGGLFEESPLDKKVKDIPDEAFAPIIGPNGLFYRFNFTVEESTPLDIEVAVDPEMLGKVFEELITGRHETGSYYTPRPVVSFMCREALKGYLAERTDAPAEALDSLVAEEHRVEGLTEAHAKGIETALDNLKAVDPACGSGAYLLGLMQEIIGIRRALKSDWLVTDPHFLYNLKLHIISRSLYGVDIDPFATEIAKLRLWLSLTVDAVTPVPLPNLDFKIETGDAILGPDPEEKPGEQGDIYRKQVETWSRSLADLKDKYLRARPGKKADLLKGISDLQKRIEKMREHAPEPGLFDWRVQFAEVFGDRGGFDIVLANPPYVRQELIRDIKPRLKKSYGDFYCGTADLYCYFYARALQLLRDGGMLSFISSNKWFRANYGANLRKRITDTCRIHGITDFGDLPVFESATAYPMIFVAQKTPKRSDDEAVPFAQVTSLDPPYPDVRAVVRKFGQALPKSAISGADWRLTDRATGDMLAIMEKNGIPLGDYVQGRIYYGIKTGFNEAFVIDGRTRQRLIDEDPKSDEIIKPFAVGRDIRRWHIEPADRWIILTKIGVDMKRYPAIMKHLTPWQPQLEKRCDKGNYWWELRACAYYDAFEEEKIVYPVLAMESRFSCDNSGYFTNDKAFILPGQGPFLTAVLNSSLMWHWLTSTCSLLMGETFELRSIYLAAVPIPDASASDRAAIKALAQKCIDAKGEGCEEWEREINERVAALYGL